MSLLRNAIIRIYIRRISGDTGVMNNEKVTYIVYCLQFASEITDEIITRGLFLRFNCNRLKTSVYR